MGGEFKGGVEVMVGREWEMMGSRETMSDDWK